MRANNYCNDIGLIAQRNFVELNTIRTAAAANEEIKCARVLDSSKTNWPDELTRSTPICAPNGKPIATHAREKNK
jgi:hypothetical protein